MTFCRTLLMRQDSWGDREILYCFVILAKLVTQQFFRLLLLTLKVTTTIQCSINIIITRRLKGIQHIFRSTCGWYFYTNTRTQKKLKIRLQKMEFTEQKILHFACFTVKKAAFGIGRSVFFRCTAVFSDKDCHSLANTHVVQIGFGYFFHYRGS